MAWGTRGMVGAGTQLTAQAGMRVRWQGGNAVDAAVAGALAAGVLEPTAHYSLGGEVAFLFYDATSGKVRSVVGQGWAAQAATVDLYMEKWGEIPPGVPSTTVPGVVSALLAMLSHYGTMSFRQVAETALGLAHKGFPAYQLLCRAIGSPDRLPNLRKYPDSARVYLRDGNPPELGSIFTQQDLGRTLSLMIQAEQQSLGQGHNREAGIDSASDVFYKGDVARRMVKALEDLGGLYTLDDFAGYQSPQEEPISSTYRGYQIFTNRTWTQGITLLQALNILEGYDLAALGHNSPAAIHFQVEALKLAFADREAFIGDPRFVKDIPMDKLLSSEYAAQRRALIRPGRAFDSAPPPGAFRSSAGGRRRPLRASGKLYASGKGTHRELKGDEAFPVWIENLTTYIGVVDKDRNMVSITASVASDFGSGMYVDGEGGGFFINNVMGRFHLDAGHANELAPRKRPRQTLNPVLVMKDGKPMMVFGTPGGDTQGQSQLQFFLNYVQFGMNVQQALEQPYAVTNAYSNSMVPHQRSKRLSVSGRIARETREELASRGHHVATHSAKGVGSVKAIVVDPDTGILMGGAAPATDGYVIGW